MITLSPEGRCLVPKAHSQLQTGARTAPSIRHVLGAWLRAGLRAGAGLGAAVGVLLTIAAGAWEAAPLGAALGGLIGAVVGLAAGAFNGLVLQALAITPLLPSTVPNRRRRAALVAVVTNLAAGLALQLWLLGWVTGLAARLWLVYAPVVAGTAMAGWLSQRLPPTS